MFLPHPRVKVSIVGSLRDREVACSASDRQGSNFESCVWRTVSSHSSHHPQEVLLAQFILYVHKGGLKPDSFTQTQLTQNIHTMYGQAGAAEPMLGQRRRRWPNINPTLVDLLVFAGIDFTLGHSVRHQTSICPALGEHWENISALQMRQ